MTDSIKDGGPAFTPGPWDVGEFSETLGYDCMTSGIRSGPVVLDGGDYGENRMGGLSDEDKARMIADAHLISAAPELFEALEPFFKLAEAVFEKYETRPGEFREAYQDRADDEALWGFNNAMITYGDLRRVRGVFAKARGET